MNTENTEPRKYQRYDEAFKRSALELWLQGGKSVATIATELGISTQSLKQWKKQLAVLPATGLPTRTKPSRTFNKKRGSTLVLPRRIRTCQSQITRAFCEKSEPDRSSSFPRGRELNHHQAATSASAAQPSSWGDHWRRAWSNPTRRHYKLDCCWHTHHQPRQHLRRTC